MGRLEPTGAEQAALVTVSLSRFMGTALAKDPKAGAARAEMHSGYRNTVVETLFRLIRQTGL